MVAKKNIHRRRCHSSKNSLQNHYSPDKIIPVSQFEKTSAKWRSMLTELQHTKRHDQGKRGSKNVVASHGLEIRLVRALQQGYSSSPISPMIRWFPQWPSEHIPASDKKGCHKIARIISALQAKQRSWVQVTLLVGLLPRPNLLAGFPSGIL